MDPLTLIIGFIVLRVLTAKSSERTIYELQAAASKTAPVTITKSITGRDLNRN